MPEITEPEHAGSAASKKLACQPANPLSKNHLKKLKKLESIAALRQERREKERERRKQKRRDAHEQGILLPPSAGTSRRALKKLSQQTNGRDCAIKIAIDLDYDDVMSSRDIAKCIKQCLHIYAINRRSKSPVELHFTGIKTNGDIHTAMMRNIGWNNWNVQFHFDKTHCDIFAKETLVFLTSDSDTTMEQLEPNCTYVIGGLVDHNHQKGLCYERAKAAGIRTARLPLDEYVNMKTRSVLTTLHVFEICVRLGEGATWPVAILKTLPTRKGAKPKSEHADAQHSAQQKSTYIELTENTESAEVEQSVNEVQSAV